MVRFLFEQTYEGAANYTYTDWCSFWSLHYFSIKECKVSGLFMIRRPFYVIYETEGEKQKGGSNNIGIIL